MVIKKQPIGRPGDDWWPERLAAMESVLGPCDGEMTTSEVPFEFGFDAGGRSDIVHFRERLPGVALATCGLIGTDDQVTNELGNYELVVCQRSDEAWGIELIGGLAYYTLDASLKPGSTMDIEGSVPAGSAISGLLFSEYGRFTVHGRRAGLLLCVGITSDELALCRQGKRGQVEAALKAADVYPFTDLFRDSVLPKAARATRGPAKSRARVGNGTP